MRAAGAPKPPGRFAALGNRHFRLLFVGGLFTFLTMQVAGIARAWLAFELTGSNTGLGGVMLAFGFCSIIAIPYGGVISDRFPKRTVLVVAGVLQAATPISLGVVVATGTETYWILIAASVVQGGVISILAPAPALLHLRDRRPGGHHQRGVPVDVHRAVGPGCRPGGRGRPDRCGLLRPGRRLLRRRGTRGS